MKTKANNGQEWASVIKNAKVGRELQRQAVSKKESKREIPC
jgi:hypothetical protein